MNEYDIQSKETFMRAALAEAEKAALAGDVPIGAVVVSDGKIIGTGYNKTEAAQDATMHAEMIAIREASQTKGAWRLTGCDVFVTTEPCTMCAGALVLARPDSVYVGTQSPKSGAFGSVKDILTTGDLNHTLHYEDGILKEECATLLKNFFAELRKKDIKVPKELTDEEA